MCGETGGIGRVGSVGFYSEEMLASTEVGWSGTTRLNEESGMRHGV